MKNTVIPFQANPTINHVTKLQENTKARYSRILQRFQDFKAEIIQLEDVGIPLTNNEQSPGKGTQAKQEIYDTASITGILRKLQEHFQNLEKVKQKVN
jgi:cell fate (sporulation/competence/biofilm development) regulator YlbF (YheA/YmcA/DUF963 family)